MFATVICDARQAWSVPCDCISDIFCASAAFRRLSCSTSLFVLIGAVELLLRRASCSPLRSGFWPPDTGRQPSGSRARSSRTSRSWRVATCCALFRASGLRGRWWCRCSPGPSPSSSRSTMRDGELVLSAMLMPAVSPNILATFAFFSACERRLPLLLDREVRDVVLEHVVLRLRAW